MVLTGPKISPDDQKRAKIAEDDLREGRLPYYILERIESMDRGNLPVTGDLSVNEFYYLQKFGIRPLGQVMGSSVYKYVSPASGYIGYIDNIPGMPGFYDLSNYNRDVLTAYDLAMGRLVMEAEALKADAVLGMTIRRRKIEIGLIEVTFVGTAVAFTSGTLKKKYGVLTSFLSGQDFCVLLENGYLPVRSVVGSSMWVYIPDYYEHMLIEGGQLGFTQILQGTAYNTEIEGLSYACSGIYKALQKKYNMLLDQDVPGHFLMGVETEFEREEFSIAIPKCNFVPGSLEIDNEAVGSYLLTGTLTGTLVTRVSASQRGAPVLPVLWLKSKDN